MFAAMIASLCMTSCLAASAPDDIQPATMTRPYLLGLYPDPYKIWIIPRTNVGSLGPPTFDTKYLSFGVVSEDLNSGNLQAVIVLDYQGSAAGSQGDLLTHIETIPPGHIDDPEPRYVDRMPFTIPTTAVPGCHSLTLIVTHAFEAFSWTPARKWDVAYAVWWLDVDDDVTTPSASLARCSAVFPRDAGTGVP
jgi:hypothetical protein